MFTKKQHSIIAMHETCVRYDICDAQILFKEIFMTENHHLRHFDNHADV